MACRDCGQAAKAVQNCKVFTFPLGQGEVDIVFRGTVAAEDVTEGLPAHADYAMHVMAHLVPTRKELADRESQAQAEKPLGRLLAEGQVRANG